MRDQNKRVVLLQSETQIEQYKLHEYCENDVIIPIGPEALFYAEQINNTICKISDLINVEQCENRITESQSRIDQVINDINVWSAQLTQEIDLEVGNYYAFQLWVIIGQVHYNYYLAKDIIEKLSPAAMLLYTKKNCSPFYRVRPDIGCILVDVFNASGLLDGIDCTIIELVEKDKSMGYMQSLLNFLPNSVIDFIRYLRDKNRLFNWGVGRERLLLVGGGYDWYSMVNIEKFSNYYSVDIIPPKSTKQQHIVSGQLFDYVKKSVVFEGRSVFDVGKLVQLINDDANFYVEIFSKARRKITRYSALISSVFSYPIENFYAHIAVQSDIPVIVWQHGEKGQSEDVTSQFTELYYATDYLAYGVEVASQYRDWVGLRYLSSVHTVGSIGKTVQWSSGETIVYATGKWLKTTSPMLSVLDPDSRLFEAHIKILGYLDSLGLPVIFKANNTTGLNSVPYLFKNVIVDYETPFTELLKTARMIILDTPATTLVEACTTEVPIFALGGRNKYYDEFIDIIKKRVVWKETADTLIESISYYLHDGVYESDEHNKEYISSYFSIQDRERVAVSVISAINGAISRDK